MNRISLIQCLGSRRPGATYLEIGVFNGHVLFQIKARRKIAVDPHFAFGPLRRLGKVITNRTNWNIEYHEKTSDAFFAEDADRLFRGRTLDIALIDGLHDYETALRDVESCVRYLKDDGVIVMHDCNPKSPAAARPSSAMAGETAERGTWNGDVWKTIVHLRSARRDLGVFVVDCDHGLGIVTRETAEASLEYTGEQIRAFRYEDLEQNRNSWLNLKSVAYLQAHFAIS